MSRLNFDRSVWRRRSRNVAIGLVMLLIVVGVVGFFVAPGIVKSVAEKQITEATGRRATIGTLALNPYTLSATIGELKLYQPDGTTIAAEVGEIFANVSSASLFRRALVFDELRIARPRLSIARVDPQRFDFSDIVDRLAAQPKSDEPARFSLNNITLEGGSIAFDDRVAQRKHTIDHITLGLPFVSNLPYATDVFVTPKFAADVNGSRIELNGKAQPFSDDRAATLEFDIADLDLPTYMAFSPVPLRFNIVSAKVGIHLVIQFRAAGKTPTGAATPQSLVLSGHVDVQDLKITDSASREAITVKRIDIDADKVDPLQSVVALKRIAIVEPHIAATRRADGSIDLVSLFALPQEPLAAKPAASATAVRSSISIASATVENGRISLTDETLATPTTTTFDGLNVSLDRLALQGNAATAFAVSVRTPDDGTIEVKGDTVVAERKASGTFKLRKFQPGAFSQYIAGFVAARIGDGSIDADGRFRFDASGPALAGGVDGLSARITKLRSLLPNEKTSFVAADAIALEGGAFDFATRAFAADALTLTAPVVVVARDAKGRWNLQAALIEKAPARPQAPAEHDAAIVIKTPDSRPFTALVKTLVVERGDVTLQDDAQSVPVRLRVAPLNVKLANIGTASGAVVPFSIDAGVERRGKLTIDGKLTAQPLSLDAEINASNVAVGWLAAYAGNRLNIVVDSADLNARGALRVQPHAGKPASADATPSVAYRGSLGIARLRAVDRATSEEFARWKTLDIPQFEFHMPATNAPLSVTTGPVTLDDFYARVIVNNTGRLNLQDVVATPGQTQSVTTPDAVATPSATKTSTAPVAAPNAPKPQVHVQGIKLTNGRIGITDNFVKPNYSANLTSLTGEVSSIASEDPKPATIRLDGKIDGDGVLTVSGQTNPFAPTLFTDISAEAKDIELTRLSPYAVKYAGYAIARGKLSTTVKYHIENGKLDAQNRLFLDQLTFGEKVDSPTATKLPVLLAVALLKNSRGEIDVNLPVSGSLSDPEFSVGGVIVRVLVNLLTRAIASPFSLIASTFGGSGSEELGYVQFKPGISDMTPEGKAKVETLAKALADRPALKLDIIGRFDPATDPDGIKRDHLLDRLKDLKAKDASKSSEHVGRNDVTIEPGEYASYLARVYDDTKLPDKPRNVVGLAKTIPTEDMEKLLLANIKLDDNDPRWLAEARADVVRHFIEDTGKVSPSRVFLVTPKLTADGIADKGLPNRVDFALR